LIAYLFSGLQWAIEGWRAERSGFGELVEIKAAVVTISI
jgi:hypothetical protein